VSAPNTPAAAGRPFAQLAALDPLIDQCVHCGFCLPTCPSYLLLGKEMDSPRGRIYMMKAGVEERADLNDHFVHHFDTCLGCMACETACPSGVRYAPLVEQTRATIEAHYPRSAGDRLFRQLLFALLPYPRRLRAIAWSLPIAKMLGRVPRLLALLPLRLRNLITLAPGRTAKGAPGAYSDVAERTPASGKARLRVGLVTGCVQRVFFAAVNHATVRVLSAEGCDVIAPRAQGCCGALALHAGRDDEARAFARKLIASFDSLELDRVVINAAGCGSTMKQYGELLAGDARWAERARAFSAKVVDVSEALSGLGAPRAPRRPLHLRVAYHDACHLAHAQGVRREPRELLESIPGLTLVPIEEQEICCGSAGIFNLIQPEMAAVLGRRKAGHIADTKPAVVATSNPGCILQIQAAFRSAGHAFPVLHVVELVDASIRGNIDFFARLRSSRLPGS
jgi:glycolate oxidase iron-sulfur subunit